MKCINCGNVIEDDCEFCYYCGCDPNVVYDPSQEKEDPALKEYEPMPLVVENEDNEEDFEDEEETPGPIKNFDYALHGENPVFEQKGSRGRNIVVYPHKCVIKVNVTVGSLITHNATDGEKTIYFKDVIGVQFKKIGFTIGYLQLETASAKGNNLSSNFFDENTFTFSKNEDEAYKIYKYIIKRMDEIKK